MKPSGTAFLALLLVLTACAASRPEAGLDVEALERDRVVAQAETYLVEDPITVTASFSERSAGGRHDYYSEGDYWWPDPENPGGPYIQRDGLSNPDAFFDHRDAMRRMSLIVPALAAAYKITGDCRYAEHAMAHLTAWFVAGETRMNPHLLYSQAISGRVTGRGIGIIDTVHLVEVARAVPFIERCASVSPYDAAGVRDWFAAYLDWMTTHEYGLAERDHSNNHSTWWAVQVAEFARLTGNDAQADFCRRMLKDVLIPNQMAPDGSFPEELRRTKPYGYMLFNLDGMAAVAWILSTPEDDLWAFELPDRRGLRKAVEFAYPFMADKSSWPYPPDVMYHDEWPVRHPSLLFAGLAYDEHRYLDLWQTLDPDPAVDEVIRNFPIRQPLLWLE